MKSTLLVLILAVLWWLGGMFAGIGISAFFGVDWVIFCGSLNMMAGMFMLLWITRSEHARRLFYEGPKGDEPGNPIIALLWIMPFSLLLAGIIWWLMAQFFQH
jgi:hypothetical protein